MKMPICLNDAVVEYEFHPTEQDKTGRDGVYIKSVDLTLQYRIRLKIAAFLMFAAALILGARIEMK